MDIILEVIIGVNKMGYQHAIKIWFRDDAPDEYRNQFSDDDLDYIAFVPRNWGDYCDGGIPSIINTSSFGCCTIVVIYNESHTLIGGYHS
jgi:hypothetical protein